MENLLFYWVFCASVDVGRFLFLNKNASGLGSTNLSEEFFGLIFPTKRIFEPTVLLLKKAARCQLFLAVVRCLFHNHLRLKCSSLLNVYLNYKSEISLLTSHLFFSLFILKCSANSFDEESYQHRCIELRTLKRKSFETIQNEQAKK